LRTLYSPLSELAEREVAEGLRVGLMLEHEVALAEIADWLGISLGEIRAPSSGWRAPVNGSSGTRTPSMNDCGVSGVSV
jgi:hypothetical protein